MRVPGFGGLAALVIVRLYFCSGSQVIAVLYSPIFHAAWAKSREEVRRAGQSVIAFRPPRCRLFRLTSPDHASWRKLLRCWLERCVFAHHNPRQWRLHGGPRKLLVI